MNISNPRNPFSTAVALVTGLLITLAAWPALSDEPGKFLPNEVEFKPGLYTGGQPTEENLRNAADADVEAVIDLRPSAETPDFNEEELVEQLGMDYHYRPVHGAGDLTRESVEWLDDKLAETEGRKTLVHCSSGNRVGALMALRAYWLYDTAPEEALDIGKRAGLTALEDDVRELLGI